MRASYQIILLLLAAGIILLLSAPSSAAQETGLMLGLRYDARIDRPLPYYAGDADSLKKASYYTVYITQRDGRARLESELDGLVIPTESGLLRAGTRRSVYNNWVEDFVWTAAPGTQPEVPGIQAYNGEHCEGYREQRILFASATHLSLEQSTAGYCEGAAYPWYFRTLAVVPVDDPAHTGLSIDDVLGTRGREAWERVIERLAETLTGDDVYLESPDPANWSIKRDHGQWVVVARVGTSDQVAVDEFEDVVVPVQLPRRLVARNDPPVAREVVQRAVPDAVDFFTSPREDVVVIVRPRRITVHPLQNGAIGRRTLEVAIPEGARPVMAHWASGARVEHLRDRLDSPRLSAERTP